MGELRMGKKIDLTNKPVVSTSVIKRLPRYRRFLKDLLGDGISRISSKELAHKMNLTASQIRQDLNCFGGFGLQGYGYNVEYLYNEIGTILGLDNIVPAILIGAGNMGKAIARQLDFKAMGFELTAIFDNAPEIIGKKINGIPVSDVAALDEFCRQRNPRAAFLCVPKSQVPALADRLVELGIKGFWNFSHYDLVHRYDNIAVESVHLSDSLMTLSYHLNETLRDNK